MTNLNPDICRKLRDARRAARLSQSELAEEVGCKQSALSMFEQGRPTKLNDEVVEKLAKKFKVELKELSASAVGGPRVSLVPPSQAFGGPTAGRTRGFCPNPSCPSNKAYAVDGRQLFFPDREMADPVGGRFCAVCGEIIEKACPNCGSPVHAGAICSLCGEPYLAV